MNAVGKRLRQVRLLAFTPKQGVHPRVPRPKPRVFPAVQQPKFEEWTGKVKKAMHLVMDSEAGNDYVAASPKASVYDAVSNAGPEVRFEILQNLALLHDYLETLGLKMEDMVEVESEARKHGLSLFGTEYENGSARGFRDFNSVELVDKIDMARDILQPLRELRAQIAHEQSEAASRKYVAEEEDVDHDVPAHLLITRANQALQLLASALQSGIEDLLALEDMSADYDRAASAATDECDVHAQLRDQAAQVRDVGDSMLDSEETYQRRIEDMMTRLGSLGDFATSPYRGMETKQSLMSMQMSMLALAARHHLMANEAQSVMPDMAATTMLPHVCFALSLVADARAFELRQRLTMMQDENEAIKASGGGAVGMIPDEARDLGLGRDYYEVGFGKAEDWRSGDHDYMDNLQNAMDEMAMHIHANGGLDKSDDDEEEGPMNDDSWEDRFYNAIMPQEDLDSMGDMVELEDEKGEKTIQRKNRIVNNMLNDRVRKYEDFLLRSKRKSRRRTPKAGKSVYPRF